MSYKKYTAECYDIKEGGEYATIFIHSSGVTGTLSIESSFGRFGNYWNNTGAENFKKWLCGLNQDYLLRKIMDEPVVFDKDKTLANAELIFDEINAEIDDPTKKLDKKLLQDLDLENETRFISSWYDTLPYEYYDYIHVIMKPNPMGEGFYNKIWLKFIEIIENEV